MSIMSGLITVAISLSFTAYGSETQQAIESHIDNERAIDFALAPIKSDSDLRSHLATMHQKASPLALLSRGARERFVQSLAFNEKGLTTYYYGDLVVELTPSQIYEALSLFGVQRTTALLPSARAVTDADRVIMSSGNVTGFADGGDYPGYACVGRATCGESLAHICMHSC